ncbi:GBF-interacting protein 1-like isoform X1 [Phoenix dactylifera]|uniref:GBF-interacting protein 1-like isoform X1 n=1 Tax=Phoenix dactylifera TaxID=42345 RepID=A0A8B8ZNW8_PHODC|nr:GBF-interacting protein 1-like isoform X1 [Phoenix dactylifera]
MSASSRVSIPNSVRRTIQNIKEIAGSHSDEEIYAMLKECSMDPNETAHKLLLQDPFHEVKRKRSRKKENREPSDSRWRPGLQGQGGRGGRGNYSHYIAHDVGGGNNGGVGKENGVIQGTDKSITSSSSPTTHDTENKSATTISSSVAGLDDGSTRMERLILGQGATCQNSGVSVNTSVEERSTTEINKMVTLPPGDIKSVSAFGQSIPNSDQFLSSRTTSTVSRVYASASGPVLVPSHDARIPGVIGAIGCEVGSQPTPGNTNINRDASRDVASSELSSINGKNSSELANSHEQGRTQSKSNGPDVIQISSQDGSSSSTTVSVSSRPSSNYSSRSQPLSGPQKVGPAKEWKPKPTSVNSAQASGVWSTSEVQPISAGTVAPSSSSISCKNTISTLQNKLDELQNKLDELQFSETHVIIPNHLQVPESQITGLSFGSFDANFGLTMRFANDPDSDKNLMLLPESSQGVTENVEEPSPIFHNVSTTQEADYPDHPQPPAQIAENTSAKEPEISSNILAAPENDQPKPEATLAPEGAQYSVVHSASTYSNFGLIPPVLGSQCTTLEGAEPQSREASHLSGFVVQQHFDPSTSYYKQIYRPAADVDGRFSPFLPPGAASKFNGSIAILHPQTGQSQQESGNSSVLSSTGPTLLVTQAAGVVPSSLAINQQPVPVFRQPAGVHLSHYPPNYFPYNQYFSPFYVPPPTLHHFLSNAAFPQQLPTGSMYLPPAAAAAANPVKYPLSQYKPPTNNGNPTHTGMPTGFSIPSSSPASYSPTPAMTSGNSTSNEDGTTQFKENNAYIDGQQSEGPTVWIPAPGRDVSSLQVGSFYNLSPQGQHVTFTPTQAGHGSFTGIYHPTPTVAAGSVQPFLQQSQAISGAIEVAGLPAGIYQQPQCAPVNWVNNH